MKYGSSAIFALATLLPLYACSSGSSVTNPIAAREDGGVEDDDQDSDSPSEEPDGGNERDDTGAPTKSDSGTPQKDGGTPTADSGTPATPAGVDALIIVPALSQSATAKYLLATDKTGPILTNKNAGGSYTFTCPATTGSTQVAYAVVEVRNTTSTVALLDVTAHVPNGFGDGSAQIAVYSAPPSAATVGACAGLYNVSCTKFSACLIDSNKQSVKINGGQSLYVMVQASYAAYTGAATLEVKTDDVF